MGNIENMGAWGHTVFEDDEGLDWFDEFCDGGQQLQELEQAFAGVNFNSDDIIEYEYCIAALVAAEIIAAAGGNRGETYPDADYFEPDEESGHQVTAPDWTTIKGYIHPGLVVSAQTAIDKVAADERSELKELWEDSEFFEEWKAYLSDLKKRLTF